MKVLFADTLVPKYGALSAIGMYPPSRYCTIPRKFIPSKMHLLWLSLMLYLLDYLCIV